MAFAQQLKPVVMGPGLRRDDMEDGRASDPIFKQRHSCSHTFAFSPHLMREVSIYFSPSENKGRGECRAADAPDSHVCDG
jgi:hypothetical protein